jgi:predicted HicB family RNase H-like nuclease
LFLACVFAAEEVEEMKGFRPRSKELDFVRKGVTRIFGNRIIRIMTTKLTLTVDKEIIEAAKAYARKNGRSLSALIENYLKALVQKKEDKEDLSPKVKSLLGSINAPKDFDYKKELQEVIMKQYPK